MIILVIFQAKCPIIHEFLLFHFHGFLLFPVLYHSELNIFGFWTISQKKQDFAMLHIKRLIEKIIIIKGFSHRADLTLDAHSLKYNTIQTLILKPFCCGQLLHQLSLLGLCKYTSVR